MELYPAFLMIFLRTFPLSHCCFSALKLTYCNIWKCFPCPIYYVWALYKKRKYYNYILFVFSFNVLRSWQEHILTIRITFVWFRSHRINYDMHRKHEYFELLACIGCTSSFHFFFNFRQSRKKIIWQVGKKCTNLSHPSLQCCPSF